MYLSKSNMTPPHNKCLLRKNILLLIAYTYLISYLLIYLLTYLIFTYCRDQSPSWETNWFSASQGIPPTPQFMDPKVLLPHLQVPTTCPYPKPVMLNAQSISNSIYLYQSLSLSPCWQTVPSSSSHSLLTFPILFTVSPHHHQSHPLHCIYSSS
jgi:hypothetical protein